MNKIERVYAEEMFITLAAACISARHPQAEWLVRHGHIDHIGLTDAALQAAIERLGVWLSDQPVTPPHPDSWAARKGA